MDKFTELRVNIGKRLAQLKSEHKLSQEKIALELDLDTSYIGRIERAERCPSLETLFKISDLFGMEVREFLTFNND